MCWSCGLCAVVAQIKSPPNSSGVLCARNFIFIYHRNDIIRFASNWCVCVCVSQLPECDGTSIEWGHFGSVPSRCPFFSLAYLVFAVNFNNMHCIRLHSRIDPFFVRHCSCPGWFGSEWLLQSETTDIWSRPFAHERKKNGENRAVWHLVRLVPWLCRFISWKLNGMQMAILDCSFPSVNDGDFSKFCQNFASKWSEHTYRWISLASICFILHYWLQPIRVKQASSMMTMSRYHQLQQHYQSF